MSTKKHRIDRIIPGSIAEELEIKPGDFLLSIDGMEIEDIFDYHYLVDEENLVMNILKANGDEWELDIEKGYDEDIGIAFENGLMDDYKSCSNKCIFCFIDQMPPGMRDSLYFKDDDSRLSFLQGNYITLTNMKDKDLDRIINLHLAPVNISVHTTNPELRCQMLNNRFAGDVLEKMKRLYEAEIEMNGQIVLCKGINDGVELDKTIEDLISFFPYMTSLSVVPVGLTKYREGLAPLEPFGKEEARAVIATIEKWQKYCMDRYFVHFVQASDEWYLTAELPLPEEERYDGYIQLENGVGMLRLLMSEFQEALQEVWENPSLQEEILKKKDTIKKVTLATGMLAAPFLEELAKGCMDVFPQYDIKVKAIRNDFFGERITVSGLITGQDLIAQLKEEEDLGRVAIPCNMLRMGEEVFLDDVTLDEVKNALQCPIDIVKSSGQDLLDVMLGMTE